MLEEVRRAHEDDPEVDLSVPVTDMLTARHLLIELARNSAKQSQYKATLASIEGEYRGRINTLKEREALVRQSLLNYAQTYGPHSFPDVGGFSVRRSKAKPVVADTEAFREWADSEGHMIAVVDQEAAWKHALALLEAEGVLVPGVTMKPAEEGLTVRGLS